MGLKLPNRACLISEDGKVLWAWEHNHPGDFDSLPPLVHDPDTGTQRILSPPNATVVDLGNFMEPGDMPEFHRDQEQLRFRRDGQGWKLRYVFDIDGEEREDDHPLERKRRMRAKKREV